MADLPAGQRSALEAALLLGRPARTSPDARAVSLAVLGVLRALASGAPLTIAIDDVQWADSPSARALAFALRRLADKPVTVIAAKRSASGEPDPLDLVGSLPDGVDRLTIGPIAPGPITQENARWPALVLSSKSMTAHRRSSSRTGWGSGWSGSPSTPG